MGPKFHLHIPLCHAQQGVWQPRTEALVNVVRPPMANVNLDKGYISQGCLLAPILESFTLSHTHNICTHLSITTRWSLLYAGLFFRVRKWF